MNSGKSKYYRFTGNASLLFALIIAFWIPSYRWILSDFIVGWIFFSIAELKFRQRLFGNLYDRFSIVSIVLQLMLFLLIAGNLFYAENIHLVSKQVMQKLSLLVFPLLFVLSGNNFKEKKLLFLKLFVLSNVVMSIVCLTIATYHAVSFGDDGSFIYNHAIYGRSFYRESILSVFQHRSYFSMYIVFSIALLFYLEEKQKYFNTRLKKIFFWLLLSFFIVMVFLMTSRAGILSLFILLSWQLIRKIFFLKNKNYKILTVILIGVMAVFILKNERIKRTVNDIISNKNIEKSINKNKTPARINLWKSAIKIIPDNIWDGTGSEEFQDIFNKTYSEYTHTDISKVRLHNLNVHNQFLEEFVKYGIFGFLILLGLFIYPIIISIKRKNYLFLSFLLITGFNFLFESMLDTIAGIVFFAFFFNYFIFVFNDKKTNLS